MMSDKIDAPVPDKIVRYDSRYLYSNYLHLVSYRQISYDGAADL